MPRIYYLVLADFGTIKKRRYIFNQVILRVTTGVYDHIYRYITIFNNDESYRGKK